MPSIELLIRKHGEKEGRKRYNEFHRRYRRQNRERISEQRRAKRLKAKKKRGK